MRFQTLFEARWILAVLIILGAVCWFLHVLARVALLCSHRLHFLISSAIRNALRRRNPSRGLAAADGVVVEIVEIEETEVVRETMRRVAIFLSVFDVHTNRAPDRWADHLPRTARRALPRRAQPGVFGEKRGHDLGIRESARSPLSSGKSPARLRGGLSAGRRLVIP